MENKRWLFQPISMQLNCAYIFKEHNYWNIKFWDGKQYIRRPLSDKWVSWCICESHVCASMDKVGPKDLEEFYWRYWSHCPRQPVQSNQSLNTKPRENLQRYIYMLYCSTVQKYMLWYKTNEYWPLIRQKIDNKNAIALSYYESISTSKRCRKAKHKMLSKSKS